MLNLKNTLDGYLKNVEVIGNTIQDTNNLTDIRSVGDKVEGQELYKIDVVSCGKNMLSEIWRDGSKGEVDTYCGFKLQLDVNKSYTIYIKYKRAISNTEDVLCAISPLVNPNNVVPNLPDKVYKTIFSRDVRHDKVIFSSECIQDDGTCYLTIYPGNHAINFELYNSFVEGLIESIQIEEGTQATEYETYKEDKLEILSPVQLEKVGDVADRIICKDGVWGVEKNVGAQVKNNVLVNTRTNSEFMPLPHDQQVKLRTFAGQTNISFLTEIAGQIKAQVPKSLGATVNTHTEQISNLNKELDRVKRLEETTVSTVETESSFTTVDATSNGYFEDVKLEGKTLVNLAIKTMDRYTITSNACYNVAKVNVKPYTTYTLAVTFSNNKCVASNDLGIFLCQTAFASGVNLSGYDANGTIVRKITTGENPGNTWTIGSRTSFEGTVDVSNFILLEGDHINNPPSYFEGLMSVGQDVEEVSVESRNSDETQSNKKPLLYYNPTTETWEKPILREWDSIEKHSDGKYYYHKRSEEVVLNGSEGWTQSWQNNSTNTCTFEGFVPQPLLKNNQQVTSTFLPLMMCDKIKPTPFGNMWQSGNVKDREDGITTYTGNKLVIVISKSKLSTQDVTGFNAWLKANPTTVVYQLAQEEVYECTNIDLMTYSGETNYIINSGAISPKSLLKVHNNISNVVKILQEKVSLLENTFIAGLRSVLAGDMYSLATILYPEDFEQNDNIENGIMVIPE